MNRTTGKKTDKKRRSEESERLFCCSGSVSLSEASLNGALAAYEQAVAALYGSMGLKNPALLPL